MDDKRLKVAMVKDVLQVHYKNGAVDRDIWLFFVAYTV